MPGEEAGSAPSPGSAAGSYGGDISPSRGPALSPAPGGRGGPCGTASPGGAAVPVPVSVPAWGPQVPALSLSPRGIVNPDAAAVPMEKGVSWGNAVQVSAGGFFFTPKLYLVTIPVTDTPGEAPPAVGGCACAVVIKNETLDAKHCRNSKFWVSSVSSLMVRALSTPRSAGPPGAPRGKARPARQRSAGAGRAGAPVSAGAELAPTQPRCLRPVPLMRSGGRRGAPGGGSPAGRLWAEGV